MKMNRKAFAAGALTLAMAWGAVALAEQAATQEGGCPMHVSGAKVNVVKTDAGVVIHVTGEDAATVAKIQAAAAGMDARHSGCKHCGAAAKGKGHQGCSCGHGASKEAAKPAAYTCPMGCYTGPQTKDGRCPKCKMTLQPVK